MEGLTISIEDIMKRLGDLNVFKSPGPDMLHPRVLKEVGGYRPTSKNNI